MSKTLAWDRKSYLTHAILPRLSREGYIHWLYILMHIYLLILQKTYEPGHEISNNMVCATSKASDQPAHRRSLIRAFASCLNIKGVLAPN